MCVCVSLSRSLCVCVRAYISDQAAFLCVISANWWISHSPPLKNMLIEKLLEKCLNEQMAGWLSDLLSHLLTKLPTHLLTQIRLYIVSRTPTVEGCRSVQISNSKNLDGVYTRTAHTCTERSVYQHARGRYLLYFVGEYWLIHHKKRCEHTVIETGHARVRDQADYPENIGKQWQEKNFGHWQSNMKMGVHCKGTLTHTHTHTHTHIYIYIYIYTNITSIIYRFINLSQRYRLYIIAMCGIKLLCFLSRWWY